MICRPAQVSLTGGAASAGIAAIKSVDTATIAARHSNPKTLRLFELRTKPSCERSTDPSWQSPMPRTSCFIRLDQSLRTGGVIPLWNSYGLTLIMPKLPALSKPYWPKQADFAAKERLLRKLSSRVIGSVTAAHAHLFRTCFALREKTHRGSLSFCDRISAEGSWA
jgi:hypothetical protein